ncbi:RICIN domain-containing protein [Oligoflexus tunisiensis]|uniref:RICIN domain-containing protein n=1 Tax=Oligoflexus tunisiensis TaxID=708132 RepID=UPI00159F2E26|nr:RICIN domain-containing protein [Oligoflexus tunisiensis]
MKVRVGYHAMIILSVNLCILACGRRSSETPELGTRDLPSQKALDDDEDRFAELEKLIRDQSEALTKLSTDKSTLQEKSNNLEAQIKALTEQLESNRTLTETQKTEMQKQITDLQAQKATLDKQITELNARNAELQKQLDAAKAENARLERELAAAKAAAANGVATSTSTTTPSAAASQFHGFRYADPDKVKNDCLGVPGGSTVDNVQLTSSACSTTALNQQFAVLDPANQYFFIKPRLSNKCMSVISSTEGTAVVQKTCTNTTDQSWEFFVRGSTEFRIRNQFSGKCLKVLTDGKLVQGDCNLNSTYFTWFTAG